MYIYIYIYIYVNMFIYIFIHMYDRRLQHVYNPPKKILSFLAPLPCVHS